ncbi:MAG TPA: hypothetical protein VM925_37080 [Labilithrix sp.]|nr:hypothetical protein [Labilithrix sp.]
MSDSAQVLAAKVDDGVVRERAKTMLDWLVGQGIVEAEEGESDLGNPAYRPGRRVLEVVEVQGPDFYDFRRLVTNGMELTVNPSPPLQSSGDELPTFCLRIDVDALWLELARLSDAREV